MGKVNLKARVSKKSGKITSYQIRIYDGHDENGKQIMSCQKYTCDPELTDKQNEIAAQEMAHEFKRQHDQGYRPEKDLTFEEYSEKFIAQKQIDSKKHSTLEGYRRVLIRVNHVIGHIPLVKLNAEHIVELYNQLKQAGIRGDKEKAVCKADLKQILKDKKITKEELSKKAGVSLVVISSCCHQKNIMPDKAQAIVDILETEATDLFDFVVDDSSLSAKTVREHQRIVYEILEDAYDKGKIPKNPAKKIKLSKVEKPEPQYFQPEELKAILAAVKEEPLNIRVMITLLAATGMRRAELVGLTWSCIDLENSFLSIDRTIMYRVGVRMYVSTPKTEKSKRKVLLPKSVVELLKKYREEWQNTKETYGSMWNNEILLPDEAGIQYSRNGDAPKVKSYPSDFLFYKTTSGKVGYPIHPDSVNGWCQKVNQRHNGLPHINPHAFRHTVVSILSYNNIDTAAIAQLVGHSNTYTTVNNVKGHKNQSSYITIKSVTFKGNTQPVEKAPNQKPD